MANLSDYTNRRKCKHGHEGSPTYLSWCHIKSKCNNPNNKDYSYYGGRGIAYDSRWEDFRNFLDDMGERPNGLTIDRIDVNGNYCKDNCRWADRLTQSINCRSRKDKRDNLPKGIRKRKPNWGYEIYFRNVYFGAYEHLEDAEKILKTYRWAYDC